MTDIATPFQVRAPSPGVTVIEIAGEVTRESDLLLQDAYGRAGADTRAIILAFDGLAYMNSSGIGLLVTLLVRAQRNRQQILACGLTDHYRQIFEITRLSDFMTIIDSGASA